MSAPDITLRRATADDAPTLTDLLHRAFLEYDGVLDPPSGVHNESEASILEKMQTGAWTIAENANGAVGCVWAEPRADYLYLGRLSVPPEHRGHGIGNALIDSVEEYARANHFPRVRLSVRLALPAMRAAYERRGYRVYKYETHPGYAEPTFVTLEKAI